MEPKLHANNLVIHNSYIMLRKKIIPSGNAYLGISIETRKPIVIKFEPNDLNNLEKENEAYNELKELERIPKLLWYGDQNKYTYLIIQLLGPSLRFLFKDCCNKKFSLGTILNISLQMISILEQIHQKGVILRYIKPSNMVIGLKENNKKIYFIDFELAKKYIKNGKHLDNIKARHIRGNRIYISANAHKGNKTSRRDDIESLGYNIIYYMKGGQLPWNNTDDMNELESIKMNISIDELCEGLPEEIKLFIKYAKEMDFYQEPDYKYLKGLLLTIAKNNNIDINNVEFDWEKNIIYNYYIKCRLEIENDLEFGMNIEKIKENTDIDNSDYLDDDFKNTIIKDEENVLKNNSNNNKDTS